MKLIGHAQQQKAISRAIEREELHHTLLFTGSKGIGKRVAAKSLAANLFCLHKSEIPSGTLSGCNNCHHCTLVASDNMPDLISIDCEDKESGSTEQIREILKTLRLKPFSGDHRLIIFDNAHALIGQAANALLKSLEEPRPGTYFALLTHTPQQMLDTIRSRSQRWGFQTLTDNELLEILQSLQEESIDQSLIPLAGGSVSQYQLLKEHQTQIQELQGELKAIARGDRDRALSLGESLAKDKDSISMSLSLLSLIGYQEMKQNQEDRLRWSVFIEDTGSLPYLLLRRHLAPHYLLQKVFLRLSSKHPEHFAIETDNSIEEMVV